MKKAFTEYTHPHLTIIKLPIDLHLSSVATGTVIKEVYEKTYVKVKGWQILLGSDIYDFRWYTN